MKFQNAIFLILIFPTSIFSQPGIRPLIDPSAACRTDDLFEIVEEIRWDPGIQRGIAVDVVIRIEVEVNKGDFRMKAPFY